MLNGGESTSDADVDDIRRWLRSMGISLGVMRKYGLFRHMTPEARMVLAREVVRVHGQLSKGHRKMGATCAGKG